MEEIKNNDRTLYVLQGVIGWKGNDFLGVFETKKLAIEYYEYIRKLNSGLYQSYTIKQTVLNDPE